MFAPIIQQLQDKAIPIDQEWRMAISEAQIALKDLSRDMEQYDTGYAALECILNSIKNGNIDNALIHYANGVGISEIIGHDLSLESISADQIALEEEKGGIWNAIKNFFKRLIEIIDNFIKKILGIKTKIEEFEQYARDHKDEIMKAMESPEGSTSNVKGYSRYHLGGKAGNTQLESCHKWSWHESKNKFAKYILEHLKVFSSPKDFIDKDFILVQDFEAKSLNSPMSASYLHSEPFETSEPITASTFGEAFKKAGWDAFFGRSESIMAPYGPAIEAIDKMVKGLSNIDAQYKDDPNKEKIGNLVMKIGKGFSSLTSVIIYSQDRYRTDIMGFAYLRPGK